MLAPSVGPLLNSPERFVHFFEDVLFVLQNVNFDIQAVAGLIGGVDRQMRDRSRRLPVLLYRLDDPLDLAG